MKKRFVKIGLLLLVLNFSIFAGCHDHGDGGDNGDSKIDTELHGMVSSMGLTGDPSQSRNIPDIHDPVAQLGMKLFFTKGLGGNKDVACASCHHPALGGGDGLSLSIGIDATNPDVLGPGRMHAGGSPNVGRNAPTTFNIAMWDQVNFWDGRVESIGKTPKANGGDGMGILTPDSENGNPDPNAGDNIVMAQCRFPVTSSDEMRGYEFEAGKNNDQVRFHLACRIGDYDIGMFELNPNQWLPDFQRAFNSNENAQALVTFSNIVKAISVYERSQVFVDSPWKRFVQGEDTAISTSAKQGALLFLKTRDNGGAGCSQCHQGDFFTDEQFHVMAVPQIGKGKGDGENKDDDFGRFRVTHLPADKYAFRTPALLNVTVMGPYGHCGSYTTLEGMARHMVDPLTAVETYDYSQLDPSIQTVNARENTQYALEKLSEDLISEGSLLKQITLTDTQIKDLVEFLLTLTDPHVDSREFLQKWIPDDSTDDPDGLQLHAIDFNGNPL